jgi:hypothetical protein
MIISGNISQVTPPDFTDRYGNQYQNITIETVNGPITGRIGSKKPYTQQNIGHNGQWDCEQAQNQQGPYNKLKRHYDTPYQGQQGPSQAAGQPNAPQDREIYIIRQAVLKAVLSGCEIPLDMVADYLKTGYQFVFSGRWDLRTGARPSPAMSGEDLGPNSRPADDVSWEN